MSEPFDKKLINHINKVFDDFEDDSADAGWIELRKRLPQPKKKRYAGWWISSAAAVLLLAGGWYFASLTGPPAKKEKLTANSSAKITAPGKNNVPPVVNSPTPVAPDRNSSVRIVVNKSSGHDESAKQPVLTKPLLSNIDESSAGSVEFIETQSQQDLTIMALSKHTWDNTTGSDDERASDIKVEPSSDLAVKEPEVLAMLPEKATLTTQLDGLISNDKSNSKTGPKLAVFAGSYFTYAEGSETSVNTRIGISSEIKLGKKISFSTGVSLGQNSLKFNTSIPQQAKLNFARTAQLSEQMSFESPALNSSGIAINTYDAKLLGLDIPFNLKYLFLEKKNSIYLITGISSNFFINESYTYNYNYASSTNPPDQPHGQSSGQFQSFDFARIINLSVGYERPLNEKTKISFEPFIKYPVSGLGSHDLRFGAAGMNLKFNFNR
ncbi:hypothetical protein ACFSJU_10940 [Paradesertivirga mongoliensis]|uniref:Outer membrane protein beta-barrel domain-containing protein n=1 Tax=Paradesertivirga mongoliensis TaxID=2100740 RepID=A0ABW4ZMW2_9SPHI|nr:hypothetical protein [Pedobacter mongoliensis]